MPRTHNRNHTNPQKGLSLIMAMDQETVDRLTTDQKLSAVVLIQRMNREQPNEEPEYHWCVNGCCLIIHEPRKDEHAWLCAQDGTIDKIDRYGNIIETISFDMDDLDTELGEDHE